MKIVDIILSKKVLAPVITIVISYFVYQLLKSIVKKIFKSKHNKNDNRRKMISDLIISIVKYFLIIMAALIILDIYGIDTKALVTSLGVVSLVAGLAVQDVLKDVVAGISIIIEEQYMIGDYVKINGFEGWVKFLSLKTTRLESFTGEIHIIPNHLIGEVTNYSKNKSLAIVDVGVAYECDVDKAITVLNDMCSKYKNDNILKAPQVLGVENLADSSVNIRIVCETKSMQQHGVRRDLNKQAKQVLDKNKISIPYPQVVVHDGKRV